MRKIKSAIFDSVFIKDLNLRLKKDEVAEIPDELFLASTDIRDFIRKGFIVCDGLPYNGKIVKLDRATITAPRSPVIEVPDTISNRVSTLEKSVGLLLSKSYMIPTPKYDDYLLYTHTFTSTDYGAMIFDVFTDNTKRHPVNPGTATIQSSTLRTSNSTDTFVFNSQVFQIDKPAIEIFPMARWSGEGFLNMFVVTGGETHQVLDTKGENNLWTAIPIEPYSDVQIILTLNSSYNSIEVSSYAVLLRLQEGLA